MSDVELVRTFNFRVTLGERPQAVLGDGAFQEVTGLEAEMDVKELYEGGSNDVVVQRIGRAKFSQRIVVKRGMFVTGGTASNELWQWFQDIVGGVHPVRRYGGTIEVLSPSLEPRATWRFRRGLPARIVGPTLNAKTGEVAIEELHIAHEGLYLEGTR